MNAPINGNGAQPQVSMLRNVQFQNGRNRVVYTLTNGMYVGEVEFQAALPDLLLPMVQDFMNFMSEQARRVTPAPAGALLALDGMAKKQ